MPETLQPNYKHFECPDCEFDTVQSKEVNTLYCPICAADCGDDIKMRSRAAYASDAPEGYDARKQF